MKSGIGPCERESAAFCDRASHFLECRFEATDYARVAAIPNAFIMEYCVEPSEISRRLARNPIRIAGGIAEVPEEPGLGIEPDPKVIEKYIVRT